MFCTGIKGFQSVVALWSHFVHWHADDAEADPKIIVSKDSLLGEVHRTTSLWCTFWDDYAKGGRKRNPTSAKLDQIAEDAFS